MPSSRRRLSGLEFPGGDLRTTHQHRSRQGVVAVRRDVEGRHAKARAGNLRNFTGVDGPYEPPDPPDLRIDITALTADEAAQLIVDMLVA